MVSICLTDFKIFKCKYSLVITDLILVAETDFNIGFKISFQLSIKRLNICNREDTNRGVYVERLSEHSVWTASDAFHVLWKAPNFQLFCHPLNIFIFCFEMQSMHCILEGLHQRHVAATQMNELSSRQGLLQ